MNDDYQLTVEYLMEPCSRCGSLDRIGVDTATESYTYCYNCELRVDVPKKKKEDATNKKS